MVFAQLAMEHPHILLLDEPTNHLDMASIDALAQAIKEYEGGVVIVSHDFREWLFLVSYFHLFYSLLVLRCVHRSVDFIPSFTIPILCSIIIRS